MSDGRAAAALNMPTAAGMTNAVGFAGFVLERSATGTLELELVPPLGLRGARSSLAGLHEPSSPRSRLQSVACVPLGGRIASRSSLRAFPSSSSSARTRARSCRRCAFRSGRSVCSTSRFVARRGFGGFAFAMPPHSAP